MRFGHILLSQDALFASQEKFFQELLMTAISATAEFEKAMKELAEEGPTW